MRASSKSARPRRDFQRTKSDDCLPRLRRKPAIRDTSRLSENENRSLACHGKDDRLKKIARLPHGEQQNLDGYERQRHNEMEDTQHSQQENEGQAVAKIDASSDLDVLKSPADTKKLETIARQKEDDDLTAKQVVTSIATVIRRPKPSLGRYGQHRAPPRRIIGSSSTSSRQ